MKKLFVLSLLTLGLFALTGCSQSKSGSSSVSTESQSQRKRFAKQDATTLLNFMYKGNTSGIEDVTNKTGDEITDYLVQKSITKQTDDFQENGNMNKFFLRINGSNYYAPDIIKDFSKAYVGQVNKINNFTIKSIKLTGSTASITASIDPIAALSEAHPIGEARTKAFGGLDNDTLVRESQNKDVKSINKLITLKLYSVYYGDMAKKAELAPDNTDLTFVMTKKGDHYTVTNDTLVAIFKAARVNKYADSQPEK